MLTKNLAVITFTVVAMLQLSGCSSYLSSTTRKGSVLLEDAVRETIACDAPTNGSRELQIQDQQAVHQGVLILFTTNCKSPRLEQPNPVPMIGYAFVEQQNGLWISKSSSYIGMLSPTSANDPVIIGNGSVDNLSVKYGRVLSPDVKLVEAVLGSGQVQREIPKNNMFVFLADASATFCELRLLGLDQKVVSQVNLQADQPCKK